ncbi:MAG TPA: hypothetical protein VHU13_00230 [Solirubrobacteraceae bacterium]|nr:hypothetical protein [Solirubrobacteraceae bacterium]
MNQTTLDGCRAKVDRAEKQLHVLTEEWRDFLKTNPYRFWIEAGAESSWYCVYFDYSTPTPPRFAVIAGEIAHNLRSALDHLAWREAVEWVGRECAEFNAYKITFPLTKTPADFKKAATLQYIREDTCAVMERHQPYNGRDDKGTKSLGLLNWFNRMDKHRSLQIVSTFLAPLLQPRDLIGFSDTARLLDVSVKVKVGQMLKGKTEVACYRFAPGPDPQMRVERTPLLGIGFPDVPQKFRGVQIADAVAQVRIVINDFANLLPER